MCPRNHESASKRKSGKTHKGSRWLRALLVVASQAAGRGKKTVLGTCFRALMARRGRKRVAGAIGHAILTIAYHVLSRREPYDDGLLRRAAEPRPPSPTLFSNSRPSNSPSRLPQPPGGVRVFSDEWSPGAPRPAAMKIAGAVLRRGVW